MPDIASLIAANRAAVDDLLATATRAESHWLTPRAPGKWSPAQVVEHVARSLEEAGNVVAGKPSKLPTLPGFIRPVAGWFLRRVVRTGSFPKAKTNRSMNPAGSTPNVPATPSAARARLDAAFSAFERECRARVAAGRPVESPAFGVVSVEDYARFTELHTRHHTKQIAIAL
jgi:peptidoglycan/xylan/chitin deacetylase (PgdA/CDA1 family)